jgi:hypothetical protein
MVRADYVSNAIALMVFVALVAAILLLGSITLELAELPSALSGPHE